MLCRNENGRKKSFNLNDFINFLWHCLISIADSRQTKGISKFASPVEFKSQKLKFINSTD